MTYEQKILAIVNILRLRTYPKDQFGFVTEQQVAEEILKTLSL